MTLIEKLEEFDALVFIHPDFGREWFLNQNLYYKRNMTIATQQFWKQGKQVFVYPYGNSWEEKAPILSCATVIPARNYIVAQLGDHDAEAWFIAWSIGKEVAQVRVASGGLLAKDCVARWLQYWCHDVLLGFEYTHQELDAKVSSSRLLGYGEVIHELTDIGGNNGTTYNRSRIA